MNSSADKKGDRSVWPVVGRKGRTVPDPVHMSFNCSGVSPETVTTYCCFYSCCHVKEELVQ